MDKQEEKESDNDESYLDGDLNDAKKRLRRLKKIRKDIVGLKKKQKSGQKLVANQEAKIERKAEVERDIKQYENKITELTKKIYHRDQRLKRKKEMMAKEYAVKQQRLEEKLERVSDCGNTRDLLKTMYELQCTKHVIGYRKDLDNMENTLIELRKQMQKMRDRNRKLLEQNKKLKEVQNENIRLKQEIAKLKKHSIQ